jgi:hypothetical protein
VFASSGFQSLGSKILLVFYNGTPQHANFFGQTLCYNISSNGCHLADIFQSVLTNCSDGGVVLPN